MQSELYFASANKAPVEIGLMRKFINVRKKRLEWIKHAIDNSEPEDRKCKHYPTEDSIKEYEKIIASMEKKLSEKILKSQQALDTSTQ
jgi:hypothetical protein